MNEFKGTQGKWEIAGSEKTFVYALNESKDRNAFSFNINNDGKISLEEIQANALLISKAPEMLEMLIKLRGELTAHTPEKIHDELEQLIKQATEIWHSKKN